MKTQTDETAVKSSVQATCKLHKEQGLLIDYYFQVDNLKLHLEYNVETVANFVRLEDSRAYSVSY